MTTMRPYPVPSNDGMAQVLEAHDEDGAEVIEAILSSAQHLNAVVGNILSFTELSAGEIKLDDQCVDLNQMVQKAVSGCGKLTALQGKTVDCAWSGRQSVSSGRSATIRRAARSTVGTTARVNGSKSAVFMPGPMISNRSPAPWL